MLFRVLLMVADLVLDCVHGCCVCGWFGCLLWVLDGCGCGGFCGARWVVKRFVVVVFVLLLLWLFVVLLIGCVLSVAFGVFELMLVLRGLLVVCG